MLFLTCTFLIYIISYKKYINITIIITVFKSALEHAHTTHEVVIIDGSGLPEEEEEVDRWR